MGRTRLEREHLAVLPADQDGPHRDDVMDPEEDPVASPFHLRVLVRVGCGDEYLHALEDVAVGAARVGLAKRLVEEVGERAVDLVAGRRAGRILV